MPYYSNMCLYILNSTLFHRRTLDIPNINYNYLMVPVEDRVVVDEDFSLFDLLLLSSFSSSETSIKGVSTRLALPVCGVLTTTTLALLTMTSAEDTGLS